VLFITSLASYHEYLPENEDSAGINRMQDALMLFRDVVENKILSNTSIILFLNKIDLLKNLLKNYPVNNYFPNSRLDGIFFNLV
jgi:guanine nucleotide-binding protein G(i) subunit alpha